LHYGLPFLFLFLFLFSSFLFFAVAGIGTGRVVAVPQLGFGHSLKASPK